MTCGTTLCPSTPPPPLTTLSNSTSATPVMLVGVPRATRTTQRFVTGEKYLTVPRHQKQKQMKKKKISSLGEQKTGGRMRRKGSPASDAPTSPQPTSPKCSSTLCFSALKTSFPDIASGGDRVVVARVWSCPGVAIAGSELDKEPAILEGRSKCSIADKGSVKERIGRTLNRTMHGLVTKQLKGEPNCLGLALVN
jgi:hypothetical protein